MATQNFFALLGEDDTDDISGLVARVESSGPPKELRKQHAQVAEPAPTKLPTKPLPPARVVRENQSDGGRGRGGWSSVGRGRFPARGRGSEGRPIRDGFQGNGFQDGRGGFRSDPLSSEYVPMEETEGGRPENGLRVWGGGRGPGRGRGRGLDGGGGGGRREYDRRSGTGRGNELKREGAGRGNWGTEFDQSNAQDLVEETIDEEKPVAMEDNEVKPTAEATLESEDVDKKKEEEEEQEDKEMTLEEYQKLLSEKRKGLEAKKSTERKVAVDKDFEHMQLVDKKADDDVFLKLGADKAKRKDVSDKEEKARKHVSINEFLKPAEGESHSRRGRGGRGHSGGGARGGYGGSFGTRSVEVPMAPYIEDPWQFPALGSK